MKRIVLAICMLTACQDDEADYPQLTTHDAQQVGSTSVVLEAEITDVGPVKPIDFGFIYDVQGSISIANGIKVFAGTTSDKRKYSIKLDNLNPATTYYFRSFAANVSYTSIYYGGTLSFTTLP